MLESVRLLGSKVAAIKNRERSLKKYYDDPAICKNCGKIIELRDSLKAAKAKRLAYCSRSCSASVTNSSHPKRLPEHKCMLCSSPINAKKRYCSDVCRNKAKYIRLQEMYKRINISNGQRVVAWRRQMKKELVELKGGKCVCCGFDKYLCAMDFHHTDPKDKEFTISSAIRSKEKCLKELEKCILVCRNCHAAIHAGHIKLENAGPLGHDPKTSPLTAECTT